MKKVVYNIKQPEEMGIASTDAGSTSSHHTERLMQLWQSKTKKRVKEEIKGGNRERGKKNNQKCG